MGLPISIFTFSIFLFETTKLSNRLIFQCRVMVRTDLDAQRGQVHALGGKVEPGVKREFAQLRLRPGAGRGGSGRAGPADRAEWTYGRGKL